MWYLLVYFTLSGDIVPEEMWSLNHKFFTLEQCTSRKVYNQRIMDALWIREGSIKTKQLTFECRLGPEMLAQS